MLSHWACLTQEPATMTLAETQDCVARLASGMQLLDLLAGVSLGMLGICLSALFLVRWRLRVLRRREPGCKE